MGFTQGLCYKKTAYNTFDKIIEVADTNLNQIFLGLLFGNNERFVNLDNTHEWIVAKKILDKEQ